MASTKRSSMTIKSRKTWSIIALKSPATGRRPLKAKSKQTEPKRYSSHCKRISAIPLITIRTMNPTAPMQPLIIIDGNPPSPLWTNCPFSISNGSVVARRPSFIRSTHLRPRSRGDPLSSRAHRSPDSLATHTIRNSISSSITANTIRHKLRTAAATTRIPTPIKRKNNNSSSSNLNHTIIIPNGFTLGKTSTSKAPPTNSHRPTSSNRHFLAATRPHRSTIRPIHFGHFHADLVGSSGRNRTACRSVNRTPSSKWPTWATC